MERFSNNEIEFLIENYKNVGSTECSKILKRFTPKQIRQKANILGLKLTREKYKKILFDSHQKTFDKYLVNPTQFMNITSLEVAYILGLLWADGYLNNTKTNQYIILSVKESDGLIFNKIFQKTGEWKVYHYPARNKTKSQLSIRTNNRPIFQFLLENDYKNKKIKSPSKILSLIPQLLHKYFWRGYFDGDGCIWLRNKLPYCCFSGPYNQDWSAHTDFLKYLGIASFKIYKKINKTGKGSSLNINKKDDNKIFLKYIYNGFEIDQLGLYRKYERFRLSKIF
jgi:hypothetical protein